MSHSLTSSKSDSLVDRGWFPFVAVVLCALAGGMAWGIRGQFGHELGAMMFGILVGFTVVVLYMPNANVLQAARVVALFTVAIGFGGSMSYGETVGLTHDTGVHGNYSDPHWNFEAFRWGMIGLAVKGGLWIGFGGVFLGLGLGGKRYRPVEMLAIGIGMLLLVFLGEWVLNSPFDPENRILPRIYFSDHWQWEADENVKPRPENWGGMLFAFVGLLAYVQFAKSDRLARNLGLWGVVGGLGFPIGQSLQSANAWDSLTFSRLSYWQYGHNSWNMMEVTFGTIAGLVLGGAVWLNRRHIRLWTKSEDVSLSAGCELSLLAAYMYFLCIGWYFGNTYFGQFHAYGHLMGIIPLVGIIGGRYWPFLYSLPIVAMPIAVKTFRNVSIRSDRIDMGIGWLLIVTIPLLVLTMVAIYFAKRSQRDATARSFGSIGLLLTSATYFWLNFTFYYPFPWEWWTDTAGLAGQKNTGGIYVISWVVLSSAATIFWGQCQTKTAKSLR